MLTLQARTYIEETTEPAGSFKIVPQEPRHPGKDAKPDCVIQLDCGEVRTHASYKAPRTWENVNNRGTKMIYLSNELFFFYWIDKYTLAQTNVNNKKTEIEIIQSQTKNKTSLPYYVHVMRDKIQKRKA